MAGAGTSALRRGREAAGLTQTDLARRAEVSRALIGSIERGRHVPAVDAALRIAKALGTSVELLFDPRPAAAPTPVLGEDLRERTLVRAARVGERVVVAALPEADAGAPGFTAADGVVEGGRLRLLPGAVASGLVVVGCDPALGIAAGLLAARGPERLVPVAGSTGRALEALAASRCHAVLVHGPAGALPTEPSATARFHLTRWQVGLGHDRALGAPSLEALLSGEVAIVQREASAASEQALVRAGRALGLAAPPPGPTAGGHLEAAQRVAWTGGAAITIEPAARAHGLGFHPLETHVVELWVPERHRDHPALGALVELLGSPAFRDRLGQYDGYDLEGCGTVAA